MRKRKTKSGASWTPLIELLRDLKLRPLARLLFAGCGSRGHRTLNLAQPGGLALEFAQVEQLGAAHLVGTNDLNLVDHLGVEGEDALHPLSKADLAHGKAALRAVALGDDRAFERLHALFIAFFDLDLNADRIARVHLRNIFALQLGSQFFHDRML